MSAWGMIRGQETEILFKLKKDRRLKVKIIIFGAGNYYSDHKKKLYGISDIQILALTDNNSKLWNKKIDGIEIIPPTTIHLLNYDKILIMSTYVAEILDQLINLKIVRDKIIIWEQLYAESLQGKIEIYHSKSDLDTARDKVLIISTSLNYNGGSLAAVYGAIALKNRGISVTLMAPGGSDIFIRETVDCGITVAISPALPYIYEKEERFIEQFDIVLINVFQMILCAQKVCRIRPVLWWIHEPSVMYPSIIMKYPESIDEEKLKNINILAVSKKAQENFNKIFPDRIKKILPYGIPDMSATGLTDRNNKKKIVFATIGAIIKLKAQDTFLNAISKIRDVHKAEFWIIGANPDNNYYKKIKNMAEKTESVKLLGEMTREEIYDAFSEIDVVVCTSQEEMLSIAITEAMMFGKVCITNDCTGNAAYIKNGVNGFVVPQNDPQSLAEQMQWIIENFDKLNSFKAQARKTYENYFSMEIFGEKLEKALLKSKKKYSYFMKN